MNRSLDQAYIVEAGITPQYIEHVLAGTPGLLGTDVDPSVATTLTGPEIALRAARCASAQDAACWYLTREALERFCDGLPVNYTGRYLMMSGYLRTYGTGIALRGSPRLFNGRRPWVYAVKKPTNDAPRVVSGDQHPEVSYAH